MGIGALAVAALVVATPLAAQAAQPGDDDFLGTAEGYAIIAADTITDTATHGTLVTGDVGLTPGTDQQLTSVQVSGDIHVNDSAATTADLDLTTGYVLLAAAGATEVVGTANLAARSTPYGAGTYFSASDLLLDGTITLTGDADDVFIFQASPGALTVGSGSTVLLGGGVQACNVYWQVGSSATIGVDAQFVGTALVATSISAEDGAQITGQLLAGALNAGAVTLDDNLIDAGSGCVRATETERLAAEAPEPGGPGSPGDSGSTGGLDVAASSEELAATGVPVLPLLLTAALLMFGGIGGLLLSRRGRGALPRR
jgi:hypothetical protein